MPGRPSSDPVTDIDELLSAFTTISLQELDEQAELLRRVDNKYAVSRSALEKLFKTLNDDHRVLEIDGRRTFSYRSTYFDTPQLRCFTDHVEDRVPRFKVRTRLYEDAEACMFEVKIKRS